MGASALRAAHVLAEMPRGLTGASPDAVNAVDGTRGAQIEMRAPAAPDESAGHVEIGRPSLRDRLLALRDDLRARLAEAELLEPSWLRTLADAEIVIAALDREGAA